MLEKCIDCIHRIEEDCLGLRGCPFDTDDNISLLKEEDVDKEEYKSLDRF